ncbi:putative cation-transporting ATPase 13A3 [Papilio xuthus]|uniref:Putative cation-transporting ATPase 13A3 n=1 Tax=Papilio xuthus TaxID=66420 RepID=A0A194QB56_PAPXU|nr:putative cation-transporting ATPase 13A3 [Papilio xuthus]
MMDSEDDIQPLIRYEQGTTRGGLINEGFQEEIGGEKGTLDSADDLYTPIHLDDGTTLNVQSYRYFRHKKQILVWETTRAAWVRLAGLESGATCSQLHAMATRAPNVQSYRYFRHKKQILVWETTRASWVRLAGLESGATCAQLHAMATRAPSADRRLRMLNIYGLNEIKVPVQSIMTLVVLEVFNPFYVFQLFTIAVWLAEPYYYYCIAVVLMSTFGVATSVIQTHKNQKTLRATVEAHDTVQLWGERSVDSRSLSPGDVLVLPPNGCILHCDAVLLTGSAILNESMLTGESVPVTKTALQRIDRPFDHKEHAASIIFCGTKVIQTRYYNNEPVRALVLRTGYNTSKGQLVRSILYPVPADFKFDRDSYKFIFILACISILGLCYTVALKASRSITVKDVVIKALDIITIVVPPALPAAMTVGRLYAVSRLRRARIACLNTRAVNVSGSLDCMCFDKTGTLTEDGLDMWGVVAVSAASAPPRLGRPQRDPRQLNDLHDLKIGMATCHSLTLLNGELAGDPLDLKMFESTGWTLEEPDVPELSNYEILTPTIVRPKKTANINVDDIHMPLEVGIVQQYQFVSSLQRSAVAVRLLGEDVLRVYCKGAPETLRTLCRPDTGAYTRIRTVYTDVRMFESTGWTLEEPDVPELSNYEILTPTIVRPKKTANINVDDIHMPLEVGIVQQYQFVSSLQRSAVAVRLLGEDVLRVYCKGAPETLRTLCRPDTVSENLNEILSSYAEKGYRVIAMSTKIMEVTFKQLQKMTRDEIECDLEFLGLVIMENRLKAATTGIIRELKEANIHVVMITGDNVHTAVSVAKECGVLQSGERVVHLVPHSDERGVTLYCESTLHGVPVGRKTSLEQVCSWRSEDSGRGSWRGSGSTGDSVPDVEAPLVMPNYKIVMTGDAWKILRERYASLVPRVVSRGAVFARMTADQKQQLIVEYQALGYYVGMCGDGANDCGALRAAHTGISLSELESSVAAPFTSSQPDVTCVTHVLREGRAALSTSFGVFKFMIAYSLTEFLSVAFLYYFDSNLTDFQYLFIDVALIVNFAFFFGMTEAHTGRLCKIPPLTSLLGFAPLVSLIGQMTLIAVIQYLSYLAMTQFPWYVRHTYEGDNANECWENYAIYTVSMFQYIILAIVFSHGAPYRRSVITNRHLMISVVIMTVVCAYLTISPAKWLSEFFQLKMPKDNLMGYIVLALASFNFVIALFFERVIVQFFMETKEVIPKCLKEKKIMKTPHLMIKRQLTDTDYLDCDSIIPTDAGS